MRGPVAFCLATDPYLARDTLKMACNVEPGDTRVPVIGGFERLRSCGGLPFIIATDELNDQIVEMMDYAITIGCHHVKVEQVSFLIRQAEREADLPE